MKRLTALFLTFIICISFTACGGDINITEVKSENNNAEADSAIIGTWEIASGNATVSFDTDKTCVVVDGNEENYVWKFDSEFGCYLLTSPHGDEVFSCFLTDDNGNDCLSMLGAKFYRQGENVKQEETSAADNVNADYVGEWKCRVIHAYIDNPIYRHDGIILNADASASYIKDIDNTVYDSPIEEKGTWVYNAEKNRIILTIDLGNMVLDISEKDGKTVLNCFNDIYYRADEFVAE